MLFSTPMQGMRMGGRPDFGKADVSFLVAFHKMAFKPAGNLKKTRLLGGVNLLCSVGSHGICPASVVRRGY